MADTDFDGTKAAPPGVVKGEQMAEFDEALRLWRESGYSLDVARQLGMVADD